MKMALPKRWEPYSPVGNQIDGTRFICFKVPLKKNLCEKLPESLRFTPDSLVQVLKERGQKLAIVIDLTNTYRYYSNEEFVKHDIKYEKIMVEGKRIPNSEAVNSFFSTVEKILAETENEDTLIGVHCTHGVNRTGYLICRYMIERMSLGADEAIKAFSTARGHPIERENFLEDLRLRENGGGGLPESKQMNKNTQAEHFSHRFTGRPERFHDRDSRYFDGYDRDGGFGDRYGRDSGFDDRYESFPESDQRYYEPEGRFDDRYVGRRNIFQEGGETFYPGGDFYQSRGGRRREDNWRAGGAQKNYRSHPYHRYYPYHRAHPSDYSGELPRGDRRSLSHRRGNRHRYNSGTSYYQADEWSGNSFGYTSFDN